MKIDDQMSANVTEFLITIRSGAENFEVARNSFMKHHHLKGTSKETIDWYKYHLETFINYVQENNITPVPQNIDKSIIEDYIFHLLDQDLEVETINGKIRTLKAFFNYLYEENMIPRNPVKKIKQLKTTDKIIETFSSEQLKALFQQPDLKKFSGFRDYVIMLILLDTGSRINELLKVHLSHVEYKESIPSAINLTQTKNRTTRVLPLSPTTGKALKIYITEKNKHFPSIPNLFVTIYGTNLKKRTFQAKLKEYGKKAGIENVRVSPHTFRHTFAKMWLMADGDPRTLQEILGHSDLRMIKIYTRLFSKDVKEKHSKFSPVSNLNL